MSRSLIRLGQDLLTLLLRQGAEQASRKSEAGGDVELAAAIRGLSSAAVVGLSGGVLSVEVPRKALEPFRNVAPKGLSFLAPILIRLFLSDRPFRVEIGAMRVVGEVGSRTLIGEVTHRTETMVPRWLIALLIRRAKPWLRPLLRALLERSTFHVPLREMLADVGDGSFGAALDSQDISVFEVDGDQIVIEFEAVPREGRAPWRP